MTRVKKKYNLRVLLLFIFIISTMGIFEALKVFFGGKKTTSREEFDKKSEKLERKVGLVSGGHSRDDGQVLAGWAITKGRRFYNEDTVYCEFHTLPDGGIAGGSSQVACMAVFDGHGGPHASKFVRDNLFKILLQHEDFATDPFSALEDAYQATDDLYLEKEEEARNDDGCTATTAVLVGRKLVVAHVGDSRAVLGENGVATPLTDDHKPNRPDERDRIETVGGTVVHAGTWRVGGVLAVSRSFGNRMLKQWIVAHPEVREDSLLSSTSCLIVATDGLWDVMTNQEAVDVVGRCSDAEAAAKALTTTAYDRGSFDNISCVVCLFNFDGEGGGGQKGKAKVAVAVADTARVPSGRLRLGKLAAGPHGNTETVLDDK